MNGTNVMRITPRLLVGLTILAVGLLWTLDNMDYIESDPYVQWWPLVLIVIGLLRLLDPHAGKAPSVVLLILGTFLLLGNLGYFDWDFGDLIPLGIALLGGKLAWDALRRRQSTPPPVDDPSANVNAFAMMAGIHRSSISHDFRGGSLNAIMGGVELDLRNAQVKEGEQALIDAFAMWGGVEITVPPNWRVIGEVMPLLGGFDDKTAGQSGNGPVLIVRGAAVMGAVVVQN